MMQTDWLIAVIGAVGTLLLLGDRTVPAMFVLRPLAPWWEGSRTPSCSVVLATPLSG